MSRMCTDPVNARSGRGFTLVEALAALVLVAVVLPFAMKAISGSAQLGVHADREARALELAETRLTEVMITRAWEQGGGTGAFDPLVFGSEADRYEWTLIVSDWENVSFKEVTVVVSWQQSGQTRDVDLTTVVYAEEL